MVGCLAPYVAIQCVGDVEDVEVHVAVWTVLA